MSGVSKYKTALLDYHDSTPAQRKTLRTKWLNAATMRRDRHAALLLFAIFGILVLRR